MTARPTPAAFLQHHTGPVFIDRLHTAAVLAGWSHAPKRRITVDESDAIALAAVDAVIERLTQWAREREDQTT